MAARPPRRCSRAVASAALALAVVASACGGEDAESAPAADTASANAVDDPAPASTRAPTDEAAATAATTSDDDGATPATEALGAAAVPIELLSFSAPLVGGGTFDGSVYAAERPVAFWFWAPT